MFQQHRELRCAWIRFIPVASYSESLLSSVARGCESMIEYLKSRAKTLIKPTALLCIPNASLDQNKEPTLWGREEWNRQLSPMYHDIDLDILH